MTVREEVQLDVTDARRAIQELGRRFDEILADLRARSVDIDVTADTRQLLRQLGTVDALIEDIATAAATVDTNFDDAAASVDRFADGLDDAATGTTQLEDNLNRVADLIDAGATGAEQLGDRFDTAVQRATDAGVAVADIADAFRDAATAAGNLADTDIDFDQAAASADAALSRIEQLGQQLDQIDDPATVPVTVDVDANAIANATNAIASLSQTVGVDLNVDLSDPEQAERILQGLEETRRVALDVDLDEIERAERSLAQLEETLDVRLDVDVTEAEQARRILESLDRDVQVIIDTDLTGVTAAQRELAGIDRRLTVDVDTENATGAVGRLASEVTGLGADIGGVNDEIATVVSGSAGFADELATQFGAIGLGVGAAAGIGLAALAQIRREQEQFRQQVANLTSALSTERGELDLFGSEAAASLAQVANISGDTADAIEQAGFSIENLIDRQAEGVSTAQALRDELLDSPEIEFRVDTSALTQAQRDNTEFIETQIATAEDAFLRLGSTQSGFVTVLASGTAEAQRQLAEQVAEAEAVLANAAERRVRDIDNIAQQFGGIEQGVFDEIITQYTDLETGTVNNVAAVRDLEIALRRSQEAFADATLEGQEGLAAVAAALQDGTINDDLATLRDEFGLGLGAVDAMEERVREFADSLDRTEPPLTITAQQFSLLQDVARGTVDPLTVIDDLFAQGLSTDEINAGLAETERLLAEAQAFAESFAVNYDATLTVGIDGQNVPATVDQILDDVDRQLQAGEERLANIEFLRSIGAENLAERFADSPEILDALVGIPLDEILERERRVNIQLQRESILQQQATISETAALQTQSDMTSALDDAAVAGRQAFNREFLGAVNDNAFFGADFGSLGAGIEDFARETVETVTGITTSVSQDLGALTQQALIGDNDDRQAAFEFVDELGAGIVALGDQIERTPRFGIDTTTAEDDIERLTAAAFDFGALGQVEVTAGVDTFGDDDLDRLTGSYSTFGSLPDETVTATVDTEGQTDVTNLIDVYGDFGSLQPVTRTATIDVDGGDDLANAIANYGGFGSLQNLTRTLTLSVEGEAALDRLLDRYGEFQALPRTIQRAVILEAQIQAADIVEIQATGGISLVQQAAGGIVTRPTVDQIGPNTMRLRGEQYRREVTIPLERGPELAAYWLRRSGLLDLTRHQFSDAERAEWAAAAPASEVHVHVPPPQPDRAAARATRELINAVQRQTDTLERRLTAIEERAATSGRRNRVGAFN